jgi:hypothetical protein
VRCEGNACHLLTLDWNPAARKYCLQNLSPFAIEVRFRNSTGWICLRLTGWEVRSLPILSFDYPVLANLCEGPT